MRWLILLLAAAPLLGGCHLLFPFNVGAAPDGALLDAAGDDTRPPPDAPNKRDNLIKSDGPIQPDGGAAPTWQVMAPTGMGPADTSSPLKIWGVNTKEIYISTGSNIYQCSDVNLQTTDLACQKVFDGTTSGAVQILGMGGFSTHVYAVGGQGILRSKVKSFGNIYLTTTDRFNGVFCSGIEDCLLVGTRNDASTGLWRIFVTYNKGKFSANYLNKVAPSFNAVWSMGNTTAVACDGCAVFMKTPTLQWVKQTPMNCTHDLRGIWGSGEKDIHAVGAGGLRLRWDGFSWGMVGTGGVNLNAIWGHSGTYFAVGDAGVIRILKAGSWSGKETFPGSDLTGVWGLSADHVYVVGKGNKILRHH